jgi:hypothetical protein
MKFNLISLSVVLLSGQFMNCPDSKDRQQQQQQQADRQLKKKQKNISNRNYKQQK